MSTRQQDWRDISLKRIVEMAEDGRFAVPPFQRKHVWSAEDNINLAVSIYRGRPINALTFIPRNGQLKIGTRALELKGIPLSDQFDFQVLDGQQRLTGMTAVFGKHQGGKQYFFDLLAILQQEFPHDLFRFKNDKLNKKYESADKICVCFEPRRLAASEDNPRFVRGRDLIAGDGMGKIVSFLNTLDIESHSAEFSAYMNKLAQLHNIGDYIVYTNIINENTPEGEAVDIFLRINRGGVPLKLGDLINAQSFQYPQITDGLKNVLAKGVRQHLKRNPAIRPALRLLEYRNENDFNIIPLLTVMHLYHSYINGKETFRLRDSLPLYSFGSLKFLAVF